MYNNINKGRIPQNNRAVAGVFLVIIGGLFLLNQLDFFFFPHWLFSWPIILIIIGVLSGIKRNFTNPSSYIMIAIGTIFLLGHLIHASLVFFWPLIIIAIGIRLVLGPDVRRQGWYGGNRSTNEHKSI